MNKRNVWKRAMRATTILALGGTAFQLSGCDPQVRSTLLSGLQTTTTGLMTTLVSAFFLSLADDNSNSSGSGGTSGNGLTTTTP
jgi:hypothetical protein